MKGYVNAALSIHSDLKFITKKLFFHSHLNLSKNPKKTIFSFPLRNENKEKSLQGFTLSIEDNRKICSSSSSKKKVS